MSSTAAASGLVVFLLSVQVIQSQDGWGVTYSPTEVCALKGSTVEIRCSYTYPSRIQHRDIRNRFWFTKKKDGEPVDLRTNSEYSGRVFYYCYEKKWCSLMITDLRENDSAEYKFRFMTNKPGDKYTGSPGVTLSVTGLQVEVSRSDSTWSLMKCLSSCVLPYRLYYYWYKNGQKINTGSSSHSVYFGSLDNYSCSVRGYEDQRSPSVYAPKLPSVSVSSSAEIVEGSSVTLTCSSDANPAANYTWYKKDGSLDPPLSEEPHLVFSSIQSSDSGQYYCRAENLMGRKRSESISIDVKYAPKLPSVSVSSSAEIVEGSSVTLTCSSDANPAANYTWYKKDEDSPKASGQIFIITDFRAEHSGSYYCEAQNNRGRSNSTLHLTVVAAWKSAVVGTTTAVLLAVVLLAVFLWVRRKKSSTQQCDGGERPVNRAQLNMDLVYDVASAPAPRQPEEHLHYSSIRFAQNQEEALYSNIRPAQPHRQTEEEEDEEDEEDEEEEEVQYTDIKTDNASSSPRTRRQEDEEDSSALYSTVNK
ncbi:B-cell receptor CD22-like isoform X2 [Cebidichthys violaceus]|uniref:B-cell receptor CD22-like isoform X2 n=1 Tax=Cebidichthys violaceus TaxID=271503 RepID=UPI0035CA8223